MRYLVTAIGSMSAEAIIGAISRQPGATTVGCNIHPREWTAASRLVDQFHQVPPARDTPAYISRLLEICASERISHIIPLTDPEVDALSAERQRFEEQDVRLCISSAKAIGLARDKLAIHQCFSGHPHIHPIPTVELGAEMPPGFPYPLLAKPRHGRSSEGHIVIPDAATLAFWRPRLVKDAYVLQPLLRGEVFVSDVVRDQNGSMSAAMTRRELLRTPNGAGMTVKMEPGHECDALAGEAAKIIGLHGCVNLEFLMVDGTPFLMDVNPRFSAGVAFSLMAGYDMVANHLRCFSSGSRIDPPVRPPDAVYVRGIIEYPPGTGHATP